MNAVDLSIITSMLPAGSSFFIVSVDPHGTTMAHTTMAPDKMYEMMELILENADKAKEIPLKDKPNL